MWSYVDSRSAVRDALRLSRAMTFKSAVAGLPLGGGKGVIMIPEGTPALSSRRRKAALLDFADTVARFEGRYITAEDVGVSSRDMAVMAERTRYVTGLSRRRGGSGDPSPYTALGVEEAIRVGCERVFGTGDLKDRTVAVLGLGHVGARLARGCARAGAKLLVSDIDGAKRSVARELDADWVDPAHALFADADVVAPCALGGVLDHESIPRLRCAVIAGSANNQLAEESLADLLRAHGILWAPDFVANAGGIINVATELDRGGYDPKRARARVRGIRDTLKRDLRRGRPDRDYAADRGDAAGTAAARGDGAGAADATGSRLTGIPFRKAMPASGSRSSGSADASRLTFTPPAALASYQPPRWPQPCGSATVPGVISSVTSTGTSTAPDLLATRAVSPSARPCASASSGCTRSACVRPPRMSSGRCASTSCASAARAGR